MGWLALPAITTAARVYDSLSRAHCLGAAALLPLNTPRHPRRRRACASGRQRLGLLRGRLGACSRAGGGGGGDGGEDCALELEEELRETADFLRCAVVGDGGAGGAWKVERSTAAPPCRSRRSACASCRG